MCFDNCNGSWRVCILFGNFWILLLVVTGRLSGMINKVEGTVDFSVIFLFLALI